MKHLIPGLVLFHLIFLLNIIFPIDTSAAQKRFALVIGNSAYKSSPLRNPANDADDMSQALERIGFQVILQKDATLRQMHDALNRFSAMIGKDDVALFYYAGHGVQKDGNNFLLPVNNSIAAAADIRYEALPVGRVLGRMEEAESLNIIILDACRNNPLGRSFSRSLDRGLAVIANKPKGSIIVYATAPGKTAADGTSRNGLFTNALLKYIEDPDTDISKMLRNVRKDVGRKSGGKQIPWSESSLYDDFFLARSEEVIDKPTPEVSTNARLSVKSNVTGANVYIDNGHIGKTPLTGVGVSAGSHRVEVKKNGYDTYRTTIKVTDGRPASLDAYLTQSKAQTGSLYVDTVPADVKVKILNIGPKFHQGMALKPGKYHVEVSAKGYAKQKRWVSIVAGEDKSVGFRLSAIYTNKSEALNSNSSQIKLAVFPGNLSGGKDPKCQDLAINALMKALRKKKDLVALTHSYYDMGKSLHFERLDNLIEDKNIWTRGSVFSSAKPNIDQICKIGKRLRVDVVILSQLETDNQLSNNSNAADPDYRILNTDEMCRIRTYLIDIGAKKMYSAREEAYCFACGESVTKIEKSINKAFSKSDIMAQSPRKVR